MLQMFNVARARIQDGVDPRWDLIAADVIVDRPSMKEYAKDMCTYVKNWAGGESGQYLRDLIDFAASLEYRREVSPTTWKLLSDIKLLEGPAYVTACLKATLVAPECYLKDGLAKLLNGSDTADISGKKRQMCIEACNMFKRADEHLNSLPELDRASRVKLASDMQIRSVMMIHGKKAKGRKFFESLDAIKQQYLTDLYNLSASFKDACPPWAFSPPSTSSNSAGHGFSGVRRPRHRQG